MKIRILLLFSLALLASSCAYFKEAPKTQPEGFGTSRASDLSVVPSQNEITVEWGVPAVLSVEVKWAAGQKYAVQITPAVGTPAWLTAETVPAIIEPPDTTSLRITAAVGEAVLGKHTITLEASAYGLQQPVRFTIDVTVRRQSGSFTPVYAGPVTVECRNICGKVSGGRVTFYDVLREKNQSCGESKLPDAQKIGPMSYGMSQNGFGYGRTCKVAAVFGSDGAMSVVNLAMGGTKLGRGQVLFSVRGADACAFSEDNTLALVGRGSDWTPYDVVTGRALGISCRISGDAGDAVLDGNRLTAGSCRWELE